MEKTEKIIRTAIFSSVGYLCAGIAVSLFAGINLWSQFLETDETVFSLAVVLIFILSAIAGIVLIRYLVPKIGAKTVYEQDILVAMIGMLFIALAINIAMLFVGVIVCTGALAVFFYENFTRQLNFVKELNHSKLNQRKQSNYLPFRLGTRTYHCSTCYLYFFKPNWCSYFKNSLCPLYRALFLVMDTAFRCS